MRALALLFVAACSQPFRPAVVYVVAPLVRERMAGDRCESASVAPAVDCAAFTTMRYDGCRWTCGPWFELVEKQDECGPIVVNGYQVESCPEVARPDPCSTFAAGADCMRTNLTPNLMPSPWMPLNVIGEER